MKQDVTFYMANPHDALKISIKFVEYKHGMAGMVVSFIRTVEVRKPLRKTRVFADTGLSASAPVSLSRLFVYEEKVGEEKVVLMGQDALLAMSCANMVGAVAVDIAHALWWQHCVMPSIDDPGHWLRVRAPKYWEYTSNVVFAERERQCAEVHDA